MSEQQWFYDEGIPGQGPRPEFLQDKFTSLAEQARSYDAAQRKLGDITGRMAPAPDSYDLSGVTEWLDPETDYLRDFTDYAKEQRLSQDVVSKALSLVTKFGEGLIPDETKEVAKLGAEGERKKTLLDQWANNTMSNKALETYKAIPKTAEVIEFMSEIRESQYQSRSQPPVSAAVRMEKETVESVRADMSSNKKRYYEDAAFRTNIEKRLEAAMAQ